MTGLKQTQLNDEPKAFWTFDYDRTGLNGNLIIDEIGNISPMIVNSDIAGDNYWLEQLSLNELEPSDQFALSVAKDDKVDGQWREQFFEVVHNNQFEFPVRGEFSVEWLMYKQRPGTIRANGEIGRYSDIVTPLISKGTVFNAIINDRYSNTDYIRVGVLGRYIYCYINTYPIFNNTLHCVATYSVVQTDINEYTSTVRFYVNGRMMGSDSETHIDTFPNTTTGASWLFCGDGGSDARYNYASELLKMDNIAVYDYPLTDQQIGNHYRKTKLYGDMIKDDQPTRYWKLDEIVDPLDDVIYADVGGINGTYKGAVNRHGEGPPRIITSVAPYFQKGSSGFIDWTSNSRFQPILNINQTYSMEFWFKSSENGRGLLFDCSDIYPSNWDGLRVYLNSKDNEHSPGHLQVSEKQDGYVNSLDVDLNGDRYLFNDDEWHHLVVRRNDTTKSFELVLDSLQHGSSIHESNTIDQPGQIHLMNGNPGDYALSGQMCDIAFYEYYLQDQMIYNRWMYSTRYKIAGYTLLQGAPVSATVRFYDTITGELVNEVLSNSVTGEYLYYPMSNRHLDILSKLPENSTTRYRVHGPVAPAEYDDSHLI